MEEKTLVIIPAFNEEEALAGVIAGVRASAPGLDILVVDDGSTDRTAEKARQGGAYLVSHAVNLGYGAALQTGYRFAARKGYAHALQMDGDGQHDPASIPDLLLPVIQEEADVAIGSRFLLPGSYRAPALRRMGAFVFGWAASRILGQRVTDPTSGFQALSRRAITGIYASDYFPADFPDADVLVMAHRAGLVIREVPVRMLPKKGSKSMHAGAKPLYYVFKMALSIFLAVVRKNPF